MLARGQAEVNYSYNWLFKLDATLNVPCSLLSHLDSQSTLFYRWIKDNMSMLFTIWPPTVWQWDNAFLNLDPFCLWTQDLCMGHKHNFFKPKLMVHPMPPRYIHDYLFSITDYERIKFCVFFWNDRIEPCSESEQLPPLSTWHRSLRYIHGVKGARWKLGLTEVRLFRMWRRPFSEIIYIVLLLSHFEYSLWLRNIRKTEMKSCYLTHSLLRMSWKRVPISSQVWAIIPWLS